MSDEVWSEDPFYSEENMKALVEAKKQLDQGKGIEFDIEKLCEKLVHAKLSKN